jgi:hypothetical protein
MRSIINSEDRAKVMYAKIWDNKIRQEARSHRDGIEEDRVLTKLMVFKALGWQLVEPVGYRG